MVSSVVGGFRRWSLAGPAGVAVQLSSKSSRLAMLGSVMRLLIVVSLEHCVEVFRFVGAATAGVSVRLGELFIFEAVGWGG